MRTRYAIAIYLVVFGWIIVAAYKMGMVHEKPVVVSGPSPNAFGTDAAASMGPIDASSVLEVREDESATPRRRPRRLQHRRNRRPCERTRRVRSALP